MSERTTFLAQISDPHVHVGRGDRDSAEGLAAAVRTVMNLEMRAHGVIVTGDLVNAPRATEYERVRELLMPLSMPVYVLAGNHDDRDAVREYFALDESTGEVGGPFRYSCRVGRLRLIACDTVRTGHDDGALDLEQRTWLAAELALEPTTPTIVAMHHPPLLTGIEALDRICLPEGDRAGLADLLALNPQVLRVIAGHVHRAIFEVLGGCGVFTCPSTYLQAPLEIPGEELHLRPEPTAIALHVLLGDAMLTHLQPIDEPH